MRWGKEIFRALFAISSVCSLAFPFSFAYPPKAAVEGLIVSTSGKTLSYSMESVNPSPSIPKTLRPKFQDGRMILEYQYRWSACRDVDHSVIVKGDSVLVQHFINGSCIKTPRVYAFRAEVNGLMRKSFTVVVQQVLPYHDKCNPPIRPLASAQVLTDTVQSAATNSPEETQGKLDFHSKMDKETLRIGFAGPVKTSDIRFRIQALEDSLIGKIPRDTLILQYQSGELVFQASYRKSQCEEHGIGIRTSGDTIQMVHLDRGKCETSSRRYGVRGKISDLPKGKFLFSVQAKNRIGGICEKDAGTFHIRELVVP